MMLTAVDVELHINDPRQEIEIVVENGDSSKKLFTLNKLLTVCTT